MHPTLDVTTPSDTEIHVTRVFDAPRSLVWDCHVEPDLVRRWLLGPDGWSMPVCEIDLRVGGRYRYVFHNDADGSEFEIGGEYRDILAPERLVTLERFEGNEAHCVLTLTEENGRTTLLQTMRFSSREHRDQALSTGMTDGMGISYDRLASTLLQPRAA